MRIQNISLLTGLVAVLAAASALPLAAQDTSYCHALVAKYQEYASDANSGRHREIDANAPARMAVDKCNAGDPSGVSVLEQALLNAGISLPRHG